MNFLKSLKWWHWLLAGVAVVGIYVAWTRFRKKGVSVDTITSEIRVFPLKAV